MQQKIVVKIGTLKINNYLLGDSIYAWASSLSHASCRYGSGCPSVRVRYRPPLRYGLALHTIYIINYHTFFGRIIQALR